MIEKVIFMREQIPPIGIRRIARTLSIGIGTVYKVMEQDLEL